MASQVLADVTSGPGASCRAQTGGRVGRGTPPRMVAVTVVTAINAAIRDFPLAKEPHDCTILDRQTAAGSLPGPGAVSPVSQ